MADSLSGGTPDELRAALRQAEQTRRKPDRKTRLLRNERSVATINIWPVLIPRASINPQRLIQLLASEFGSTIDRAALLRNVPEEARGGVPSEAALSHALAGEDAIYFVGGRLSDKESNRLTPIQLLGFGEQSLRASVSGTTDEAEYLCKRLGILLSMTAGIQRVWGDFEPHIEAISYLTTTVVDLGFPLVDLLSPAMKGFISDSITGKDGFGRRMGDFSWEGIHAERDKLNVTIGVHQLHFKLVVQDEVSGQSDKCDLEFLTHTTSDLNRSRVKFTSALSSTDHDALVERLVSSVRAS